MGSPLEVKIARLGLLFQEMVGEKVRVKSTYQKKKLDNPKLALNHELQMEHWFNLLQEQTNL